MFVVDGLAYDVVLGRNFLNDHGCHYYNYSLRFPSDETIPPGPSRDRWPHGCNHTYWQPWPNAIASSWCSCDTHHRWNPAWQRFTASLLLPPFTTNNSTRDEKDDTPIRNDHDNSIERRTRFQDANVDRDDDELKYADIDDYIPEIVTEGNVVNDNDTDAENDKTSDEDAKHVKDIAVDDNDVAKDVKGETDDTDNADETKQIGNDNANDNVNDDAPVDDDDDNTEDGETFDNSIHAEVVVDDDADNNQVETDDSVDVEDDTYVRDDKEYGDTNDNDDTKVKETEVVLMRIYLLKKTKPKILPKKKRIYMYWRKQSQRNK